MVLSGCGELGSPGKRARPKDFRILGQRAGRGVEHGAPLGWVSGTHEAGLGHPQNWAGA